MTLLEEEFPLIARFLNICGGMINSNPGRDVILMFRPQQEMHTMETSRIPGRSGHRWNGWWVYHLRQIVFSGAES